MKRVWVGVMIALLGVVAAHGQATCSPSNPCVKLSWTAPGMAATVTASSAGVQTAGPGNAVVWSCMGGATSCSQSALALAMAGQTSATLCPASQNTWSCVTKAQISTAGTYNDPEPYGSLMNYAVQSAWSSGGGASAASPIWTFQVPQAPTQTAPVPGTPAAVMVTSGNVG